MPDIDQTRAQVDSEVPTDRVTKTKTMYDVGAFELMWRNLLAGSMRALGSILMYLVFIYFLATLFTQLVLPQIQPFLDRYDAALGAMGTMNQVQNSDNQSESINMQELLQDPQVQDLLRRLD